MTPEPHRVLFVCTYNSLRSPMAAAILNAVPGDRYRAESAGLFPSPVDQGVVAVMQEKGTDVSNHHPRSLGSCSDERYGTIVFLSDSVQERAYHLPFTEDIITLNIPVPGVSGIDGLDGYRRLCRELSGAIALCFPDAGIEDMHCSDDI